MRPCIHIYTYSKLQPIVTSITRRNTFFLKIDVSSLRAHCKMRLSYDMYMYVPKSMRSRKIKIDIRQERAKLRESPAGPDRQKTRSIRGGYYARLQKFVKFSPENPENVGCKNVTRRIVSGIFPSPYIPGPEGDGSALKPILSYPRGGKERVREREIWTDEG